jgi:hypothetical protein
VAIRPILVGAVTGVVAAGLTGVAAGMIPDSGGAIHACYKRTAAPTKPLKLLNTGEAKSCSAGWAAITWSQAGPPGASGATGPPGPPGATVTHHELVGGPVTVAQGGSAPISLSDPTFQAAEDALVAIYGTIDAPNGGNCDNQFIQVSLNGVPKFNLSTGDPASGPLADYGPIFLNLHSADTQALTATMMNECSRNVPFVLNDLTMNVSVIG